MLGWAAHVVDGDDEALAAAALAALTRADLVIVRTDTAMLAAAAGQTARRDALSMLDARLLAPIAGVLAEAGPFTLVVTADCVIDSAVHAAVRGGSPCAVLTDADSNSAQARFVETECARSGFHLTPQELAELLAG